MSNKRAWELMEEGAATWRARNMAYGDSYHRHGDVMMALFPDGVTLNTAREHNNFGIITLIVAKLERYCHQVGKGGHHLDSIHDIGVYAFMLEELNRMEEDDDHI